MYALDINFLDDRKDATIEAAERVPIADTQFLIGGGALMAVALALAAGAYFFVQYSASGVQQQLDALNSQDKALDAKLADLAGSEKSIKAITDRTTTLVNLFVGDIPASALLDEIKNRTPVNIKIDTITQTDKTIKIKGQGSSFNDVNDFLLLLQASPYFEPTETRLDNAKRQDDKNDSKFPPPVDYDLTVTLTNKPATQLLPDLQRSGAEGIVSRIKLLQQKGVITQ